MTTPRSPSYFTDPTITPADLRAFFVAAREFWSAQPWALECEMMARVTIPALAVEGALCELKSSPHGVVLFPKMTDFRGMLQGWGRLMSDSFKPTHSALELYFREEKKLTNEQRAEAAEHGWSAPSQRVYPVLNRLEQGQSVPLRGDDLRVLTATLRAMTRATHEGREQGVEYELELEATYTDEDGIETSIHSPHPELYGFGDDEPETGRIQPRGESPAAWWEREVSAFSFHRLLGACCAAVSAPDLLQPIDWHELIGMVAPFRDEAHSRSVSREVASWLHETEERLQDGDYDRLVPDASEDVACREWAQGFASILTYVSADYVVEPAILGALVTIQIVAERQETIEELKLAPDDQRLPQLQADCRQKLAKELASLYERWAIERARALGRRIKVITDDESLDRATSSTVQRTGPKVGRNDPCPCGSGKKHKKCCLNV